MSTQSAFLARALVEEHQRDALERARANRLAVAVRWQRRAMRAAARAARARAAL
jgi:hypothetical protein